MLSPYFPSKIVLESAKDYTAINLPSLTHFAILADEFPDWELEVVIAYAERLGGLDTPYPEVPKGFSEMFDGI